MAIWLQRKLCEKLYESVLDPIILGFNSRFAVE